MAAATTDRRGQGVCFAARPEAGQRERRGPGQGDADRRRGRAGGRTRRDGLSEPGARRPPRWPSSWRRKRAWICARCPARGPRGKIVKEDVSVADRGEARPRPAARPSAGCAASRPAARACPKSEVLERIPLKGVRGIIAERMAASAHTTARVTLVMEVDATEFVAAPRAAQSAGREGLGLCAGLQRPAGQDRGGGPA